MKKIFILTLILCSQLNGFEPKRFLVFGGKTGWIGQKIVRLLSDMGHTPICAASRLENREAIEKELKSTNPDFIVNCAGIIGKPNVDWCETHKEDTIRTNVIGTLNLADIAFQHNLHLTNISTGCIYEYDTTHPMGSGIGFTEEDEPNFDGSFYSRTKIQMEKLLMAYRNVLNLRVKMPVSTELDKGFVGKIAKYKKLVNIPNSLTILDDLLPLVIDMTLRKIKGIYNFVNPGAITHNEVMDLYKKYIDPNHTHENFTEEEQNKILLARRANAELSAAKLLELYPTVPHIKDALEQLFKKIINN